MTKGWITVCFAFAAVSAGPAYADMYTWVDKDGITHVSNLAPPSDVRVTKVARTAPRDPAREAGLGEMRALRERVDELSKEVAQSRNDALPPPYAPAPAMAFVPPAASPAPTVVVTVINQPAQPAQSDFAPSACDYTFGGCGSYFPYFPGYAYYAPPIQRGFHRPHHHRKWGATPTRQGQGALIPPLIPYPTSTHSAPGRRLG